jgi:beta-lysine 5,6-aminomutase alpha subunit
MIHLHLDQEQIGRVKQKAADIAGEIQKFIDGHSSVSVERSVLRLYGVDGVNEEGTPLPNVLVDMLAEKDLIGYGISRSFAAAMLESGRDAVTTAELIANGKIDFGNVEKHSPADLLQKERELATSAIANLDWTRRRKSEKILKLNLPPQPWRYIIVATGNIYEDRTQAQGAAMAGADIVAVIRSTAQSLLDYVPYGPTTEGFGGTFATQENFRIMRRALDEASEKEGRYIRLVNYSSGLCMAEIAVCAALEDLDVLLNDSMYGILFRDINMKRTFIDQYFSRLICSRSGIIINTGEDNYLTTSDAIDNAYTVTASQLINEAMAKTAHLGPELMGLGHAYEINPQVENALLYEISHALLARDLFPESPLKYMPPTKYKSTDIFYSHCLDTMFNFVSVLTQQGIHLTGILTEALHTPLMQDRYKSLSSVNYVFNIARGLSDEIEIKEDGFINRRANHVLNEVEHFLNEVAENGLMEAIAQGRFADIKRPIEGGKGLEGVFEKKLGYSNPVLETLKHEGVINE